MASKFSETDENHSSQGLNACSTPVRENESMDMTISSSCSTIDKECPADPGNEIFESSKSLVHLMNDCNSDDELIPELAQKKKQKKLHRGTIWNIIKPKNKQSLYYKIINEKSEIQTLASNWCDSYTVDKYKALEGLFKLFIDLMGVQNFRLSLLWSTDFDNIQKVVKKLENEIICSNLELYYLCNNTSVVCLENLKIVFQFINYVFIQSVELFFFSDVDFINYTHKFLSCLCKSELKVVSHTGIYIASKLLTFMSRIDRKLSLTRLEIINNDEKQILLKVEGIFYNLIYKDCFKVPRVPGNMKKQCLREIVHWFKNIPNWAFSENYFSCPLLLVEDPMSSKIRYLALKVCKHVSKTAESEHMIPQLDQLIKVVEDRLWDLDYEVSIAAIDLFNSLLDTYLEHIPNKTIVAILKFTLHYESYDLAKAAGTFTVKYLKAIFTTPKDFVLGLVDVAEMFEVVLPAFVQSLLQSSEELRDYELLYKIILLGDYSNVQKRILFHLMTEVVIQLVTGKSSISRNNKSKFITYSEGSQVENIIKLFIPQLHQLFVDNCEDQQILKYLLQMLLCFNFDSTISSKYIRNFNQIMDFLREAFFTSVDAELLGLISKIISVFLSEKSALKSFAKKTFKIVFTQSCQSYMSTLDNICEQSDGSSPEDMELIVLRLEKLLENNNLTNDIEWDTLLSLCNLKEDLVSIKFLQYNIKCCYWWLIWQARTLGNLGNVQNIRKLKAIFDNVVLICNAVLKENMDEEGGTCADTAFEIICDLNLQFLNILSLKFEKDMHSTNFNLKIESIEQQNTLINYVINNVFITRETENLSIRRSHLSKLMSLFVAGILPLKDNLVQIFKFYDKFSSSYKDIFDKTLRMLHEMSDVVINSLVYSTLKSSYLDLTNFNQNSEEFNKIKSLADRFLQFVKKQVPEEVANILKSAVCFAIRGSQYCNFIYVFKSYISAIKLRKQRKSLMDYVMKSLPKDDRETRSALLDLVTKLRKPPKAEAKENSDDSLDDSSVDNNTDESEEFIDDATFE